MTSYQHIKVPAEGQKITVNADMSLNVPDQPIIPYIEGDGTGFDITPVMLKVVDAAVAKAYGGKRKIHWMEVYAGEKSTKVYGPDVWLPEETCGAQGLRGLHQGPADHAGGRRHPLAERGAAPGTGPVRLPAPRAVLQGRALAREGARQDQHGDLPRELRRHLRRHRIRSRVRQGQEAHQVPAGRIGRQEDPLPETSGIGVKPVSREGTERLVRKAIQYAIDNDKPSVTIVHKGNIMKFTEGGFRDWAYALAQKEFGAELIDGGPWCKFKNPKTGKDIVIKDSIADAFLQQICCARPNTP
jgi:isocitrate dehydrogenase